MIGLLNRNPHFFDLFDELASRVVSSAERFQQFLIAFPNNAPQARLVHEEEEQADDVTHRVLARLDRTFLPPIDREDVHDLAHALDGIIDDVAQRVGLYHVDSMEPGLIQQAGLLAQAAAKVSEAVNRLCKSRRLSDLRETLIEIHRLESAGDDYHHAALTWLFDGSHPPLFVLKWKELFTPIEKAIDACEDVGNILERIVMKGA